MNEGGPDGKKFMIEAQRKFLILATNYMIEGKVDKSIPSSSFFYTYLLTYVNRFIIADRVWFIQEVLGVLH